MLLSVFAHYRLAVFSEVLFADEDHNPRHSRLEGPTFQHHTNRADESQSTYHIPEGHLNEKQRLLETGTCAQVDS